VRIEVRQSDADESVLPVVSIGNSNALFDRRTECAVVAQAPVWTRIGRSRVGFHQRGGATPRLPWPFPADSRQRAEHGAVGSLPLRVVFLVSPSASWPAGCHAATAGGARGAGR